MPNNILNCPMCPQYEEAGIANVWPSPAYSLFWLLESGSAPEGPHWWSSRPGLWALWSREEMEVAGGRTGLGGQGLREWHWGVEKELWCTSRVTIPLVCWGHSQAMCFLLVTLQCVDLAKQELCFPEFLFLDVSQLRLAPDNGVQDLEGKGKEAALSLMLWRSVEGQMPLCPHLSLGAGCVIGAAGWPLRAPAGHMGTSSCRPVLWLRLEVVRDGGVVCPCSLSRDLQPSPDYLCDRPLASTRCCTCSRVFLVGSHSYIDLAPAGNPSFSIIHCGSASATEPWPAHWSQG